MRNTTTFSVSKERGQQLRQLARHHNLSVGDLVARWIDADLDVNGLAAPIPGVSIIRASATVQFGIGDVTIGLRAKDEAIMLALTIEQVIDAGGGRVVEPSEGSVEITRRGAGVVIELRRSGRIRRVFAKNVARLIAVELRKAADT